MRTLSAVMHSLQYKTPFNEWIDPTGDRQDGRWTMQLRNCMTTDAVVVETEAAIKASII